MELKKHDRWNINNIKATVRMAYEGGYLQGKLVNEGRTSRINFYENVDGYRCAVGLLLTTDELRFIHGKVAANSTTVKHMEERFQFFSKAGCDRDTIEFLELLQNLHDGMIDKDTETEFCEFIGIEEKETV